MPLLHRSPRRALRLAPWLLCLGAPLAHAQPLRLAPAGDHAFKLDAYFDDWQARRVLPVHSLQGGCTGADLEPKVQVGYGPSTVWIAAQVKDDRFVAGDTTGDGLSLHFTLPGGERRALRVALHDLEPPDPARIEPWPGSPPPQGAQIVATARADGWAVELRIPRKWLPGFTEGPVGFSAIITDRDADPTQTEAICVAGDRPDAEGWPPPTTLLAGDPLDYIQRFEQEQGRAGDTVLLSLRGDVTGDGEAERIQITKRDVIVASHALPSGGPGYLFFGHGWPAGTRIVRHELIELDGRPGPELLIERDSEIVLGETSVRVVEIYGVHDGYFKRMFAHKLEERVPSQSLRAEATLKIGAQRKGPRSLEVSPAKVEGFNPGNVVADVDGDAPPYRLFRWPWQAKKAQVYQLRNDQWQPR